MSSLNFSQLKKIVHEIESLLVGSQLQDVFIVKNDYLIMQHYIKGIINLGVFLASPTPSLGLLFQEVKKKNASLKPIVLFIKAHAKNKILKKIQVIEKMGRVVQLEYEGSGDVCTVQLVLIPRALNIIVTCGDKQISFHPQKYLPPPILSPDNNEDFSVQDYFDSWALKFEKPLMVKPETEEILVLRKQRIIEKKTAALEQLESDLIKLQIPWLSLGEFLKNYQTLEAPDEWLQFVDSKKSLSENIQNCFENHKIQERKRENITEKIKHLKNELIHLQEQNNLDFQKNKNKGDKKIQSIASQLMSKADAKGRKFVLNEKVEALVGKTAKDNLSLLRKAQAWDIWVHLRDFPSAHAIIRRPRGIQINQQDILKVAEWVLRNSVKDSSLAKGDKYQIIWTECRYVTPIKGDKIGRVIYHNEQSILLQL